MIGAADQLRRGEPSAEDGKEREDHQRNGHVLGRFVDVHLVMVEALVAEESEKNQPEHVERGEARADEAQQPENQIRVRAGAGGFEDFVLAEKAGEAGNAGDGQRGDEHRPVSDGNLLAQAAHVAHVLLAAHGVDHAARGEEEQALEEGVGHQVEDSGGVGAHAAAEEHVAELRDGGVGENFLDVGLHQADGGGVKRRERADDGDDQHGHRRAGEERVHARDHVDAGGDHGGGVDQRADRRGAFHGVRQPDVERKLAPTFRWRR